MISWHHPRNEVIYLVGVGLEDGLQLVIVELGVTVGNSHEEPHQAGEVVALDVFEEEAAPESAVRGNAGARGHQNKHCVRVLREQQDLAGGACRGHKEESSGMSCHMKISEGAKFFGGAAC